MERSEMRTRRFPLDEATADRLAAGELHPHDAPPGYAAVAAVLTSAHADPVPTEIDDALLGSMVRSISTSPVPTPERKPTVISKLLTAKVAGLAAATVLTTTGAAAAATGNLPAPAQDAVAEAVSHVGFDLPASGDDHPDGDDHRTVDDDTRDDHPTGDDHQTGNTDNPTESDDHGADVSGTARTTESTGRDKGAEVSETARDDHGHDDSDDSDGNDGSDDGDDAHGRPVDPGSQAPGTTVAGDDHADDDHADDHGDDGDEDDDSDDDHQDGTDDPGTRRRG